MNNKKILNIVLIIGILLIMIGGTFAWLNYRSKNTALVLTVGDIKGMFVTVKPYQIKGTLDFADNYLDSEALVINVDATNNNINKAERFSLYFDISSIDTELKQSEYFKWKITKSTDNGSTYQEVANSYYINTETYGNFTNASVEEDLIIYSEEVPANTTNPYKYKVYIWLENDSSANQSNLSFNAELRASIQNQQQTSVPTFISTGAVLDNINSTYVQNATPGIDFSQSSSDTNGKGVYIVSSTQNDLNPIYYYRGAVDNNNVFFGGYCWKIVRTTSTGGIKMIYNGVPSNNSCGTGTTSQQYANIGCSAFNSYYDDPKYVGYTYDTNTDSTIKAFVESWYNTNLKTNYESYIDDTEFCIDREEHSISDNYTNYKPYNRYNTSSPDLSCKSEYTYNLKVGLLSLDEAMYAGGKDNNSTYYLNNNDDWWLLSPRSFSYGNAFVFVVSYSGFLGDVSVGNPYGARPVVSLKPGLTFEYGNGSGGNPYRFVSAMTAGANNGIRCYGGTDD